jgi:predicted GTPase
MQKVTKVLKENATNIAFIGRPNVGKSSLFNRLLGELTRCTVLVPYCWERREEKSVEKQREVRLMILTAAKQICVH